MRKIKVIHLGYSDNYGGASVAMNRINEALSLNSEVDSKIATIVPSGNVNTINLSDTILASCWTYIRVRLAYKIVNLLQKTSNNSGRSINFMPSSVFRKISKLDFDILHLHWIGNETIRLEDLRKFNKPIVWTFHDTWPLLGAEHTDIRLSNRFKEGYTRSNKPIDSKGLDVDRWTWKRKLKIFELKKIQPVVVSSWLLAETKKSFLWRDSIPEIVHNPIKGESWLKLDRARSRRELNIPTSNKVIAFGAINAFTDELKGYEKLEKAVHIVSERMKDENITLLVFGDPEVKENNLNNNVVLSSIGKINDFKTLNTIYSASDLVVVPSYLETFGQVAVEAIACGTPVVAFRTSGLMDIIVEGLNGYLSEPYLIEDLADKIFKSLHMVWDQNAMREDVNSRFGYSIIAKKYEALYKKTLSL